MRFSPNLRRKLSALRRTDTVAARPPDGCRAAVKSADAVARPAPSRAQAPPAPWFDEEELWAMEMESLTTREGPIEVRRLTLPLPGIPQLHPYQSAGDEALTCVFFDTETLGLGSQPIFMAGFAWLGANSLVIEQVFARDYSREAALLRRLCDVWERAALVVTFNGRSYDIPLAKDRVVRHRLGRLETVPDIDLLPLARRRWSRDLPDCRLTTLEFHLLGRARTGDVPGAEIPPLYHRSVRSGDVGLLAPVFYHNALDLITMVELLPRLVSEEESSAD